MLQIHEIEGQKMKGQTVRINQNGMINGMRRKKDGIAYFGFNCGKHNEYNDFVFESDLSTDKAFDRFLKISYDSENRCYHFYGENFNEDSCAVFIKIERIFKLNRRHLISLGHVHLAIDLDNKNLIIEVIQANEESKTSVFPPEKLSVKVGRSRDNDIVLDSTAFSRIHTQFFYRNEEEAWFLTDGCEGKPSTNGTWILLDFDWKINDRLSFRLGTSLIQIDKF